MNLQNYNGIPTPSSNYSNSQKSENTNQQDSRFSVPSISHPKGGGAVRSIAEEFSTNSFTGTANIAVPIFISPGRSGFDPKLSLSYDSGSGNGPFGLGWNLSLPSITRKTEKGLPRYDDSGESDVFILSGAEDLVPELVKDEQNFKIQYYRPRREGLFARIERWTDLETGEIHWRSISKDNITIIYGKSENSRIFDPSNNTHIFSWLICESFDDKGNVIFYQYKREDSDGIDETALHERNRTIKSRSSQIYPYSIKYGNRIPYFPYENLNDSLETRNDFMFELVFDYGENYFIENNENTDNGQSLILDRHNSPNGLNRWMVRQDEFSNYRSGFEIRTSRLCKSIKMIHHFPDELGVEDYLVGSTDFSYEEHPVLTYLSRVYHSSYKLRNDNTTYRKKYLPPLDFEYSKPNLNKEVNEVHDEFLENIPASVGNDDTGSRNYYQWIDLDSEGLTGILCKQEEGWYYKRNLSPSSSYDDRDHDTNGSKNKIYAKFSALEKVDWIPSSSAIMSSGNSGQKNNIQYQLMDLAHDGKLDLVQLDSTNGISGYFERRGDKNWDSFIPFKSNPNVSWSDPNLRFIDLNGDGFAEILITEDQVLTYYKSLGEDGFEYGERISKSFDEEKGPRIVFSDTAQTVFIADMSGDGLQDIVEIKNGSVSYWPNIGYGRFGPKVTMNNSPFFDRPDQFDPQRIKLVDSDGKGFTDLIYCGRNTISIFINESGNSWSNPIIIENFPRMDSLSTVDAIDLLGNGTGCLVWTSNLPGNARRNMRYIELTGGIKPHLLESIRNNMGAETKIYYAPSTKFYLKDKFEGTPWLTKIPFVMYVVEKVETIDYINKNIFETISSYHHGFYHEKERSFIGFGRVESIDTQQFEVFKREHELDNIGEITNWDQKFHVPPTKTKIWHHNGMYIKGVSLSEQFKKEYFKDPDLNLDLNSDELDKFLLKDTIIPTSFTVDEERKLTAFEEQEAVFALRGSVLRKEVYALDESIYSQNPYVVSESNYNVDALQPIVENNRNGVFLVTPRETVTFNYERNPKDPRIAHELILETDQYGQVKKSVNIGYGRLTPIQLDPNIPPIDQQIEIQASEIQKKTFATYSENDYTNEIDQDHDHRIPVLYESKVYEIHNLKFENLSTIGIQNNFNQIKNILFDIDIDHKLEYHQSPENINNIYIRLIEHNRTVFRNKDFSGPMTLGQIDTLAIPFQSYTLAFTPDLISNVYEDKVNNEMLSDQGKYFQFPGDPNWWIQSSKIFYWNSTDDDPAGELAFAKQHFYLPHRAEDPFENNSFVEYDKNDLLVKKTIDALDNTASITGIEGNEDFVTIDYRLLKPSIVTDPNGNRSQVVFDTLGFVVGTSVMGKIGEGKGDSQGLSLDIEDFNPDLEYDEIQEHLYDPFGSNPNSILGKATSRIIYDMFRFKQSTDSEDPSPNVIYTIVRETHESDLVQGDQTKTQVSFSYFDGFGREIQKKIQAEPGPLDINDPNSPPIPSRWVGSGWTIFNNKGNPVKQCQPFFDGDHDFKFAKIEGVSPTLFYDPLERVIGTLYPNNTWEKIHFNPWRQESWDVNDTVLVSDPRNDMVLGDHFRRLFPGSNDYTSWYDSKINGTDSDEQRAAEKTAVHSETPAVSYTDSLGRVFLTVANNGNDLRYKTHIELDIEGNQKSIKDAMDRIVVLYEYNIAGIRIIEKSMDAGEKLVLFDIQQNPIYQWDSRHFQKHIVYDLLRRPTKLYVKENSEPEFLAEETIYGESKPDPEDSDPEVTNHRLKIWKVKDGAGEMTNDNYDFKGNLLISNRRLLSDYKTQVNWASSPSPNLEDEIFSSSTIFDALNRPIQMIYPHSNRPGTKLNIVRPIYNEANLLEGIDGWLEQDSESDRLLDPITATHHFVKNIDYNEKGQRILIEYGNDVITSFEYDELTFRLKRLHTSRTGDDLQDLSYNYDANGLITKIVDDAQQIIFFNEQVIKPDTEYTYDSIYRLIESHGREHIGSLSVPQTTWNDKYRIFHIHPNDGQKMRRYSEFYEYDDINNIKNIDHNTINGNWNRIYSYNEPSLIESESNDKKNNQLSQTIIHPNSQTPITEEYDYDKHGNMISMPPLQHMKYDFKDQLAVVDLGGGGNAFYMYNISGQRIKKIHKHNGNLIEERIYLGNYEIYRKKNLNGLTLERETVHIMDDKQIIALIDTRTRGNDNCIRQSIRYQLTNHIGSSSLELDETSKIISYEEYYPYGGTSYQAQKNMCDINLKRYRYVQKERDEETGLYYYGARYYIPWLARWLNCDPDGVIDGLNVYSFVKVNPIKYIDKIGLEKEDPLLDYRTPLPLSHTKPTKKEARRNANKGAKEFRKTHGMSGSDVQAGHTLAARHAPESGVQPEHMNDPKTFQKLHSRKGKGLDVEVTDPNRKGKKTRTTTRHRAQEGMIDDAVERVKKAQGELTPQGQADAAAEVRWRSKNIPLDQDNVERLRSSGLAKSDPTLSVDAKESKKALKVASKLSKAGKLLLAAVPFVGASVGHVSAAHAASQGNYKEAALDEAGNVPVAGDVLDAARAGMAVGEALDEGLEISDKASSVGIAVQETLTDIGINEDVSYVVGGVATVASIGTITVASTAEAAAETATSAATSAAKAVADTTTSVAKSTWNWLVN